MKELLQQIQQRTNKLLEEVEKLEDLEFSYHTLCTLTDYNQIVDQKGYINFLTLKLKTSVALIGEIE